MYNPLKLAMELQAAGISIDGCAATGRVDFKAEATDEQRILAVEIVATHDSRPTYAELREREYPPTGELIVALWERVVEGRPEAADALQAKREVVKAKYPKPVVL